MDVSLVVCTKNFAGRLIDTLPYWSRLKTRVSWEILFVNNGSTDATAEVLTAFAGSAAVDVKVVEEAKPGVSAARNTGWHRASGNVIGFTDHDCYPAPDYIDQICACFSQRDLGYVGGRVLLYDPHDAPVTIQPLAHRLDIPPRSFLRTGLIHGANMAFRRDVLERVGDFDENMGPGTALPSGEDIDVLARASALGYTGAYDPRPIVFHHHRRSTAEDVNRLMAAYDIGRGAYYAKGLIDRRRRWLYVWPTVRRIAGNIWRRDFAVMHREFHGAWKYITS